MCVCVRCRQGSPTCTGEVQAWQHSGQHADVYAHACVDACLGNCVCLLGGCLWDAASIHVMAAGAHGQVAHIAHVYAHVRAADLPYPQPHPSVSSNGVCIVRAACAFDTPASVAPFHTCVAGGEAIVM